MRPRLALITGASSGIGKSVALELARNGVDLHLVARGRERLETVAAEVREAGARAWVHAVDVTDDDAARALVAEIARGGRALDVFVHAAGTVALGAVATAPIEDLDAQYRVNLRAAYVLTQALLPCLRAAEGQIVYVNSGAGLHARPTWSQYAATKHALRALADALREELQGSGVRVLSVYPGRTATPMQEAVHGIEGKEYDPDRFLRPEDVARQVVVALSLPPGATVTDLSIRPTRS